MTDAEFAILMAKEVARRVSDNVEERRAQALMDRLHGAPLDWAAADADDVVRSEFAFAESEAREEMADEDFGE